MDKINHRILNYYVNKAYHDMNTLEVDCLTNIIN